MMPNRHFELVVAALDFKMAVCDVLSRNLAHETETIIRGTGIECTRQQLTAVQFEQARSDRAVDFSLTTDKDFL